MTRTSLLSQQERERKKQREAEKSRERPRKAERGREKLGISRIVFCTHVHHLWDQAITLTLTDQAITLTLTDQAITLTLTDLGRNHDWAD